MSGLNPSTLPSPSLSSSSFSSTSAFTNQVPGQPFRRLLPAGAGAGAGAAAAEMDAASDTGNSSFDPVTSPITGPTSNGAVTASPPDHPKRGAGRKGRQITTAACDPCRKRKTRVTTSLYLKQARRLLTHTPPVRWPTTNVLGLC